MATVMFSSKRRFIAGAVCPRCSEMDKIVAYQVGNKSHRECIACGFSEEMRFQPRLRELDTRVNKDQNDERTETRVVKLMDKKPVK